MTMSKVFFATLGLLTLFETNAWGAEWVALHDAGLDQYAYDNSKLVIKDEEITYWKKVVFKTPQSVKGREAVSGILRERIHCGEHTAKLLSYLYYAAGGETLDYVAQDDSAEMPIIPDSVGDAFERALCPQVWRKQEENRIKAEQANAEAELKAPTKKKEESKPSIASPAKPLPPQVPNVHVPESVPTLPLPMPKIMDLDQLY